MAQKKPSLSALKEKAAAHNQKAKAIQAKIREIENEQFLQIGKLIVDFHKRNWDGFKTEELKKTIHEIIST